MCHSSLKTHCRIQGDQALLRIYFDLSITLGRRCECLPFEQSASFGLLADQFNHIRMFVHKQVPLTKPSF
jgi:hypothetical protein